MTHKELVDLAARQLKRWHCIPVCTELVSYTRTGEIPDAIGWTAYVSIMLHEEFSKRLDPMYSVIWSSSQDFPMVRMSGQAMPNL